MRGGTFTVEQAGGRNQANSRTHAGDGHAFGTAALQPGDDRGIALDHIVNAQAGGGDKNQIGFADIFESQVGLNLNVAITVDRASTGGGGSNMEAGSEFGAGENVPQRTSVTKDFHGANGSRGKHLVEKKDGDLSHRAPH